MRACYRVVYYQGGIPATAFVVADSDNEASAFIGVVDGSASVTRVAYPVEVAGVDVRHDPIPAIAPTVAPFDLPRTVSRAEFDALSAKFDSLQAQQSGAKKAK